MEYNIYITNACNLNCEYCSSLFDCEKNKIPRLPQYPDSDLAAFIKRTAEQFNDRDVMLFLFGGEPTLEYARIASLLACLEQELAGYNLKPILHTNGLLLDAIPDTVLSTLSLIMYSINYERIPKYNLGNGYFSTVIDNALGVRKKSGVPMVARVTVTEKTSLFAEIVLVDRFFDYVHWQLENCAVLANFDAFYATYTYEVRLLFDDWLRRLQGGVLLHYIPFMAVLKFMFFHDRDDSLFCCGYDRHMIFVQTDGSCYACCDNVPGGLHAIGDIAGGVEFRDFRLTDFCCRDCAYRPLCMGRCGRMHREFSAARIDEYCRLNRFMFDLFIENKAVLQKTLHRYPEYENKLSGWLLDVMEYTP
ncbi:radical SAM protein [Desulfobulbus sp.]|uniref:radical SAM protein n=1 Tax=Desulfobulbus sp. TaxID=895 RepID=UPI00286EF1FB|nr:radical SAM protein [Desulfobulbus sp.]